MKKIIFYSVLILTNLNLVQSQTDSNTLLPLSLPLNPEATNVFKFHQNPINKYTGVPDINIPIYELKTKGFNLPISINYHSGGIKVNEEASWVGLGWNLSADAQINQNVLGLDDFGYYKSRIIPDYECLIPEQAGGLSASTAMSTSTPFFLGFKDN